MKDAITDRPSGSTILVCPGTYGERLSINKDLILIGGWTQPTVLTVAATGGSVVTVSGTVELRQLSITGGSADDDGGGIRNGGTLKVVGCTISRNGTDRAGGGIATLGLASDVTIEDSLITENTARFSGGGVFNPTGSLSIVRSRIHANKVTVAEGGGGIGNSGTMTLSDTSVTANVATSQLPPAQRGQVSGGGIRNSAVLGLINTTVSGNHALDTGGGVHNISGGSVTLSGTSAVVGNTPNNCIGTAACSA